MTSSSLVRRGGGLLGVVATEPAILFTAFRRYFAIHLFLQATEVWWSSWSRLTVGTLLAGLLAAVALSWHRRLYPLGLLAFLGFKLFQIQDGFPMTGNHLWVEMGLIVILLAFSEDQREPDPQAAVDATGVRLVQLAILSIYFYSGVHKLVHGFWLDGEYLGQALYSEGSVGFWYTMQLILRGVASLFGLDLPELPLPQSAGLGEAAVVVPGWTVPVLLLVSWLTVLSEVAIPVLVVWRRTRSFGIHLMLWMSVAVGLMSWELDFMYVAVGAILLFFPRRPVRNYLLLGIIHVLWSSWVLFGDLRLSVL